MDTFDAVYRVYFQDVYRYLRKLTGGQALPEDTLPLRQVRNTLKIRRRASALLAGFSWLTRPIYLSDTDLVTVSTDEEGYVSVVSFDKQVTGCRAIETFELVEEAEDPERDIYEENVGLLTVNLFAALVVAGTLRRTQK